MDGMCRNCWPVSKATMPPTTSGYLTETFVMPPRSFRTGIAGNQLRNEPKTHPRVLGPKSCEFLFLRSPYISLLSQPSRYYSILQPFFQSNSSITACVDCRLPIYLIPAFTTSLPVHKTPHSCLVTFSLHLLYHHSYSWPFLLFFRILRWSQPLGLPNSWFHYLSSNRRNPPFTSCDSFSSPSLVFLAFPEIFTKNHKLGHVIHNPSNQITRNISFYSLHLRLSNLTKFYKKFHTCKLPIPSVLSKSQLKFLPKSLQGSNGHLFWCFGFGLFSHWAWRRPCPGLSPGSSLPFPTLL